MRIPFSPGMFHQWPFFQDQLLVCAGDVALDVLDLHLDGLGNQLLVLQLFDLVRAASCLCM